MSDQTSNVIGLWGLIAAVALGSANARAEEQDAEKTFTVESVETQVLDEETGGVLDSRVKFMPTLPLLRGRTGFGAGDLASITEIINVGKEIWEIVVENKAVVDIASERATAIPTGVSDWRKMPGWKAPQARLFRMSFKNFYGATVVDFTYRVLFTPGGTLNGRGKYLTGMTILPAKIWAAWGFTFRSRGSIPSIMNANTTRDPLAAAELQLTWSVESLTQQHGSASFYVRGDGHFQQL